MSKEHGSILGTVIKIDDPANVSYCQKCEDNSICLKCPHRAEYFKKELERFFTQVEVLKKKRTGE